MPTLSTRAVGKGPPVGGKPGLVARPTVLKVSANHPVGTLIARSIDSIEVVMNHRESEEKILETRKLVGNFMYSSKR